MVYRFISKGKTAFKISLPTPEGKRINRSIGFVRKGESKAIKEAIKLRNELGRDHWKKFWPRVLRDEKLLHRISKMNVQPRLTTIKYNVNGNEFKKEVYCVQWMDENGVQCYASRATKKHGRAAAYLIAKRIMYDGMERYLDILLYMEIITRADLRQVNTYLKDIKQ